MTRDQLIQKRIKKKRIRLAAAIGAAAAAVLVPLFVIRPLLNQPKKRQVTESAAEQLVENNASDTAQRAVLADGRAGSSGWNADDSGWWFMNDDGTVWTNGWKTIEGQKYWFTDRGYMATGWVNTGGVTDSYFDESGMLDSSKRQKLIALTYDDGPSSNTDKLLDALDRYGAKATFFVVGMQAEYYNEQLKREYELGMEIGNHSWDHPWLNMSTSEEISNQMQRNDDLISKVTGAPTRLMRPTGGGVGVDLLNTIKKPMIEWDVDTLDWEHLDPEQTYDRITRLTREGSIILMHDLFAPSADAADNYLNWLVSEGYKMVTVSELAEAYGYDLENGGEYYAFYPEGCELNKTKEEGLYALQNASDDEDE